MIRYFVFGDTIQCLSCPGSKWSRTNTQHVTNILNPLFTDSETDHSFTTVSALRWVNMVVTPLFSLHYTSSLISKSGFISKDNTAWGDGVQALKVYMWEECCGTVSEAAMIDEEHYSSESREPGQAAPNLRSGPRGKDDEGEEEKRERERER